MTNATVYLFDQIKADQIAARKARISGKATLLTTLLGEITAVGKKQNRDPNDEEIIAVIKKFIKGIDECLAVEKDEFKLMDLILEKAVLDLYLPKQLSNEQIEDILQALYIAKKSPLTLKEIMAHFKQNYAGFYDGKNLSTLSAEAVKSQT